MQSPRSLRRHLPVRWLTILTVVALATAALVSPAAAGPPVHYQFVFTGDPGTLTGVCSFDIWYQGTATVMATDFFDNNGTPLRTYWHVVEQDTFIANGKTLVSLPYTYNAQVRYDSSGSVTGLDSSGAVVRIRLPDGSLFSSAGRTDWMGHPPGTMLLSPDHGHSGNLDAFCAALAP